MKAYLLIFVKCLIAECDVFSLILVIDLHYVFFYAIMNLK